MTQSISKILLVIFIANFLTSSQALADEVFAYETKVDCTEMYFESPWNCSSTFRVCESDYRDCLEGVNRFVVNLPLLPRDPAVQACDVARNECFSMAEKMDTCESKVIGADLKIYHACTLLAYCLYIYEDPKDLIVCSEAIQSLFGLK